MSAKLADILNDSEGTQSESDDADCGEGDAMQSSNELGEKSWPEGEDSDLGEDVPTKSRKKMKAKYKRKKADWEDVKSWDRDATEEDHIQQETINIANEFMQQCGLPFIAGARKSNKQPPLGMWPYLGRKLIKGGAVEVFYHFVCS